MQILLPDLPEEELHNKVWIFLFFWQVRKPGESELPHLPQKILWFLPPVL